MKLKMKYAALPVLALLGAASVSGAAWGQANPSTSATCFTDENTPLMCQISVVGNLPTSLSEDSEAIAEIDVDTGQRIENTLRDVAGVQQFRRSDARSANPTSQGVTLRGLGGNASSRAMLFVDGVPQADPFGGWISWPQYDALNLASIRVRRGGGHAAAGPGAISGVIELDSQQRSPRNFASASYGSRGSVDMSGGGMFDLGGGQVSASGSYARSDGFTPIAEDQRGSVDRPAPYEQAAVNLRAVVPFSEDTQLQANIRGFIDERDRGFDFSNNENSGVDASIRIANLYGDLKWSALAYVQLREFSTRFGSVAADRNSVRLVLDQYSVPSTGLGARFEIRPPVGDNAEIRIGADWRRTIGETSENFLFTELTPARSRNAGGRTDNYGLYAQGSLKSDGGLTLTAGGRIDRWQISNGFRREIELSDGSVRSDENFADRSGWQGSGRAGIAWQPGGNSAVTLRSSAYLGWRLPTLNELFRPFRVGADATAANELLKPEHLRGGEIGVDFDNGDDIEFSVTAFWNRLDDAIANVTLSDGGGFFPGVGFVSSAGVYRQRLNLDAIESRGVELDARYDLSDMFEINTGYESLLLRASYAYTDAKVIGKGDALALDGLRPAQVPEHTVSLSLDYDDRPGFKAGFTLRYIGSQFEDEGNSRKLGDAFTADMRFGYVLDDLENWTIEARAENLFDAEIQAAISSSGILELTAPRTFWLGLRVKL